MKRIAFSILAPAAIVFSLWFFVLMMNTGLPENKYKTMNDGIVESAQNSWLIPAGFLIPGMLIGYAVYPSL